MMISKLFGVMLVMSSLAINGHAQFSNIQFGLGGKIFIGDKAQTKNEFDYSTRRSGLVMGEAKTVLAQIRSLSEVIYLGYDHLSFSAFLLSNYDIGKRFSIRFGPAIDYVNKRSIRTTVSTTSELLSYEVIDGSDNPVGNFNYSSIEDLVELIGGGYDAGFREQFWLASISMTCFFKLGQNWRVGLGAKYARPIASKLDNKQLNNLAHLPQYADGSYLADDIVVAAVELNYELKNFGSAYLSVVQSITDQHYSRPEFFSPFIGNHYPTTLELGLAVDLFRFKNTEGDLGDR